MFHFSRFFYRNKENAAKEKLCEENAALTDEVQRLRKIYEIERKEKEEAQARIGTLEEEKRELEEQIKALKKEIARLNGIIDLDGNNSGTPTSKTPLNKKKRIPNSRSKTGKKKGGQEGHTKASLPAFSEDEITEDEMHEYTHCPQCGGKVRLTGVETCKDELDYEVVVIKRRHHYPEYECEKCGKRFRQPIPARLKEQNQYGIRTQALALSLMNVGNVSVNKVRKIIYGLSQGNVNPTEGYIISLQRKAAKALEDFRKELIRECLLLKVLYWDDTVIFIDKKRACLRFYGDERIALYFAHMRKDKAGIDEDGILPLLAKTTKVMHDHNIVNYNDDYSFTNIECNQHLLRDLQKVTDNLHRSWSERLRNHIQKTIHDRNEAVKEGKKEFESSYQEAFFQEYTQIMIQANQEHLQGEEEYYYSKEAALIKRLLDYKDNYFAWVCSFEYPVTNNLSERGLRNSKTHLKVSGQFQSEEYAQYYATVQSYIETCKRNGINEMRALMRLCDGRPYTVDEIMLGSDDE